MSEAERAFWVTMATVIPVVALALVVLLRDRATLESELETHDYRRLLWFGAALGIGLGMAELACLYLLYVDIDVVPLAFLLIGLTGLTLVWIAAWPFLLEAIRKPSSRDKRLLG